MGSSARSSVRVLHVDDDADFADLTATFLEREDDRLTVETATSAAAGLERLDGDVDCVVSDYDMPRTNGIEFLEQVRETYPDLPFILFTGKGSETVASEAISAGVTDYLQKETGSDQYALLANRLLNAVDRYGAEREAELTRERFETLLADSGDYIHVLDTDGTVQYVTPSIERVLGYTPAEVEGTDAFDIAHPEDRAEAREGFEKICANPDLESTYELRVEHAAGGWRWVEIKSRNLLDDPAVEGIVGNVRNVTARKDRERALERERERFSALFENFPEPTITYEYVDGEPIVRAVNDAFQATFGFDAADCVDRPIDDLIVPPDRRDEAETVDRRVREGESVDEVLYRQTADGGRHFKFRNISIPLEAGPDGFGVYIDIEDRTAREQELERQNERLEAFTTIVSHDLRNPLSVASQSLTLGREACDNEHFERVADSLESMEALIDDLLTLARQGDKVGDVEPVTLENAVRECWSSVETTDARLVVGDELHLHADRGRLKQLVENLLRNAIEHGHGDVTITVGALPGRDGFFVADDGPGIPPEARETVFEGGYTTREEGTGFGLTIVSEIAAAHGWDVRVTDGEDGGARFEITGVDLVE